MVVSRRVSAGRLFDIANYALMLLLAVAMLYPFWETLVVSVMPPEQAISWGLKLYPRAVVFGAYRIALSSKLIKWGYYNTMLRTVVGTVATVFLSFCTAYPLAKRRLPARSAITIFYIIPMFFQGGLIPSYLLVRSLGMMNTRWALIVPALLGTYNILIMRNFIMSIPESVEESAVIDGASFFRVLVSLIIPLSVPIMATIALWVAVNHWNAWFDAMIYIRDETKSVLQLVLRRVLIDQDSTAMGEGSDSVTRGEAVVPVSVQAATVIVSIGPILLSYPFVQRYFVKGIMVGSLKG